MRILVTGATGYVGGALIPRLLEGGHDVRAFAREARRVAPGVEVVEGDAVTGAGLAAALDGVEVAYYLIHSMEPGEAGSFSERERRAVANFAAAARTAGARRSVYLGGLVPDLGRRSAHLSSRQAVEDALLEALPDSVALRASIVIGARSRSFRFLVRLVERVPVLALPSWRANRTQPVDGRDVIEALAACATASAAGGRSLDLAGPDVVTYQQLIEHIRDAMLITRPPLELPLSVTPIASRVAAVIAGEDHELIGPLMEGLDGDLLPRPSHDAGPVLGLRLHGLDAAVERALREWESEEELAAR